MTRLLIAAAVLAVVVATDRVIGARRRVDEPTHDDRWSVPTQIDRADFDRPETPWLVAVFSSATCDACASMVAKARVLATDAVVVQEIEFVRDKALHERYSIDAVPTTIVVDQQGVVRDSFLGPVSATDLWAAVAGVRDPSSRPVERCQRHDANEAPDPEGSDASPG